MNAKTSWSFTFIATGEMGSKNLAILFVFVFNAFLNAQSSISGVVNDDVNNNAIEFATVVIKNSDIGVYTDINGYFTLIKDYIGENDSLVISYIGYESKIIALGDVLLDGLTVKLVPKNIKLNSATIKASKIKRYKKRKIGVGRKRTNDSFSSRVHSTYEFAVYISNSEKQNGFFKSIDIYITQFDFNNDPFRLNLYSFDPNCSCPGESFLRSSQYISKAKKGWNSISIEDQYIEIPEDGFYISYERLPLNGMSDLNPQHHSIGWIKDLDYARHQTYTRLGDNAWSIENRFTRKGYIPLVRSIVKTY